MAASRVIEEELAAFGVLAGRSQAHAAFLVVQVAKLGAQVVGRATVAIAAGVAALGHEIGHHAVEIQIIIELLADQRDEAGHCAGRFVGL